MIILNKHKNKQKMYILKFKLSINWFYVLLLTIISLTDCNDSFSTNELIKSKRSNSQLDAEITNNNNNNNKGSSSLVTTNKTITTNNTNIIGIKRSKDSSRKSS